MTQSQPTIFVQIAAYRDVECQWTIKDLYEKAAHPERINVGVCWQVHKTEDADCFEIASPYPKNTMNLMVDIQRSKGVCWARHRAQSLYDGEDYVLMIDSHMRFIPNWDLAIREQLKACKSEKPFLSCYPPGYTPPNNLLPDPRPSVMCARAFDNFGDLRFTGVTLAETPHAPLKGAFLAAGFLFAAGSFISDVPYDPHTYFANEELNLALRAYTHGWDAYSPSQTLIYHYYNIHSGEETTKTLHWNDHRDWHKLAEKSRQRVSYLYENIEPKDLSYIKDIEKYPLGTTRTIADFESYTGINLANKTTSEKAEKAQFIDNLEIYKPAYPKPTEPPEQSS